MAEEKIKDTIPGDIPGEIQKMSFEEALAETGVDREDAVMIGDTIFDIQMARAAGTAAVGVSWGVHEADELHDAGAGHVIDRFDELVPVVQRLIGD